VLKAAARGLDQQLKIVMLRAGDPLLIKPQRRTLEHRPIRQPLRTKLRFQPSQIALPVRPRHPTHTEKVQDLDPMPPARSAGEIVAVELRRIDPNLLCQMGDCRRRNLSFVTRKATLEPAKAQQSAEPKPGPRGLVLDPG
jgi:hypothetical protein